MSNNIYMSILLVRSGRQYCCGWLESFKDSGLVFVSIVYGSHRGHLAAVTHACQETFGNQLDNVGVPRQCKRAGLEIIA
eukprot:scaffold16145_cov23-Prasinocladus_malaysianus.AAC.1